MKIFLDDIIDVIVLGRSSTNGSVIEETSKSYLSILDTLQAMKYRLLFSTRKLI